MAKNTPTPVPEMDERGVRATIERLAKAWNAHDAVALVDCMTGDVSLVGLLGERYEGREIVELSYRHVFDTILQGSRGAFTIEQIRFLRSDVAVAIQHQKVTSRLPREALASTARQRQLSETLHDSEARTTFTLVRQGKTWLIAALHSTLVASTITGRSQ